MDGLLLDSERLAQAAFVQACYDVGVSVDAETYARCIGSNSEATARVLSAALGSEDRFERLRGRWSELYQARITSSAVPLKPGARELLAALLAFDVPRALATSTSRPTATAKLERAGVISAFSCLICGGETPRGKPHPDPYLAAVAALGTTAEASWALEDSENGVRSAHAAGLTVFQVPDIVPPSAELLSLGHRVAADLYEVLHDLERTFAG